MKPRKRIFIGLLAASLIVVLLILGLLAYLLLNSSYSRIFMYALAIAVGTLIPVVSLGLGLLVLALLSNRAFSSLSSVMRMAVDMLFPIAVLLGKIFRIEKERIESSFIEVNNRLVRNKGEKFEPERVMVLIPHCLQKADCSHKITVDLNNCQRCGSCNVSDLIAIQEECGVNLLVATGGTQARRMVKQYRPRAIVAVACERELASGIQDVDVLPVLAVPNERPEGPCRNTRVDLGKLRETISYFVKGGS